VRSVKSHRLSINGLVREIDIFSGDRVMDKRLYRSRTDRTSAGVCGGIAEYLGWDPTLVRVGWIILTLLGGSGILIYLIMWLVMPEAP
jgi:phage shock protein PspC (stress-responsive transcriptional regulator)